jgi:hypothetical protein
LRQEVLERFGWRIHRVWSRDWVVRREIEIRRLREAIEKALGSKHNPVASKSYGKDEKQSKFVTERNPGPNDNNVYPWVFRYKVWRPNGKPSLESEEGKISNSELSKMLNQIVDVEGPLHIELALHRLASNLGFQRVGSRVRVAVEHSIKTLIKEGRIKKLNKFLWPNKGDFNLAVRQPVIQEKESYRTIKFVPPEEIELAITNLVHAAMSITEGDIIREVARIFGLDRVSSNIYDRLKKILDQMISRGELISMGERISISGKE